MDDLLHAWNLPQLCELFREQEITVDALEALTDADITELIPKVGPRALFRKRLTEWLNMTSMEAAANETTKEEDGNENETYEYIEEQQYYEEEIIDEAQENEDEYYYTNELGISNEIEIENQQSVEDVIEDSVEANFSLDNERVDDDDVNADECDSIDFIEIEEIDEFEQNPTKEADTAYLIVHEINNELPTTTTATDNEDTQAVTTTRYLNVRELLASTKEGRSIIENYDWKSHMAKETRLFITDLIITQVFAMNLVLDRAKFEDIAAQIIEIFPNENIHTWYTPRSKKSHNSGGTLFNKYYSVYRKMRKTGFYDHYVEGLTNEQDAIDNEVAHCAIEIDANAPEKMAFQRAIPKYERLRRSCDFQRIHVNDLLENSFEGRGIVDVYKKHNIFDVQTRNRLCKLVVMEALKKNIKMRPRDFYDISCQIAERFPSESVDVYFLPRGRTPPKGCLYHKYLYIKRRLRKIGLGNKQFGSRELRSLLKEEC